MFNILPKHIALIPDGNRRWAKVNNMSILSAYRIGVKKVKEFLDWCLEFKIPEITIYVLSLENFLKRPRYEINFLLQLLKNELISVRYDKKIHDNKVKIKVFGKLELLPNDILKEIEETEKITKNYSQYYLNLAIVYSGRYEIIDIFKKLIHLIQNNKISINDINESILTNLSYLGDTPYPEPDLVIRTGFEKRLSNFLIYEIAYSEFFFIDKYWPDFTKEDFIKIIYEFSRRERRFGK